MFIFAHFADYLQTQSFAFPGLLVKFQVFKDYPLNSRFPTSTREIPGFSGLTMKLQVFPDYPWNYRFSRTTHEIPGVLRKFQVLNDYSSRFSNTMIFPSSPILPIKFHVLQNYPLNSRFSRTRTNPVWPNQITIGIVNSNFLQNRITKQVKLSRTAASQCFPYGVRSVVINTRCEMTRVNSLAARLNALYGSVLNI